MYLFICFLEIIIVSKLKKELTDDEIEDAVWSGIEKGYENQFGRKPTPLTSDDADIIIKSKDNGEAVEIIVNKLERQFRKNIYKKD